MAGLILSLENYEPNLVQEIIQKTTLDLDTPGYDTIYGWGRIRVDKAIQSVNNRPRNLTVSAFNQHPRLSWDAVPNAGGYFIYKGYVQNMNTIYNQIGEVYAPSTYYIDTEETIDPNQPLDKMVSYRVSAVLSTIGETAKSNKAQIRVNGSSMEKKITDIKYILEQNYPNPFNPTTKIKYSIKEAGLISLKVYDLLGREIIALVNESKDAGEYEVEFNSNQYRLTSGVYFYQLVVNGANPITSGSFTSTKKLVLTK